MIISIVSSYGNHFNQALVWIIKLMSKLKIIPFQYLCSKIPTPKLWNETRREIKNIDSF